MTKDSPRISLGNAVPPETLLRFLSLTQRSTDITDAWGEPAEESRYVREYKEGRIRTFVDERAPEIITVGLEFDGIVVFEAVTSEGPRTAHVVRWIPSANLETGWEAWLMAQSPKPKVRTFGDLSWEPEGEGE